jgi:hypothetical protein
VLGMTDFPVFERSAATEYLPAPNQSGALLNKNDWAFNDLSMGVAE